MDWRYRAGVRTRAAARHARLDEGRAHAFQLRRLDAPGMPVQRHIDEQAGRQVDQGAGRQHVGTLLARQQAVAEADPDRLHVRVAGRYVVEGIGPSGRPNG
jgi:hypothetical protein